MHFYFTFGLKVKILPFIFVANYIFIFIALRILIYLNIHFFNGRLLYVEISIYYNAYIMKINE